MPRPDPVSIPKRIIQTAKERTLTLKQRAFVANIRLLNADFEWCFFDDAAVQRFVDQEFPEYRATFDAFPSHIQRVDFFRYLAVYRMGGFYFDLDVLLAQGLTDLCVHSCVFPFEGLTFSKHLRDHGMDWELGNYAFGACAGHPFLEAVIGNCVKALEDASWADKMMRGVPALSKSAYKILYTTGPGVLSRTLAETPHLSSDITVLFPDDVCDPSGWNQFGRFGVHLMDGSWRPSVGRVRRRLVQRYEAWSLSRVIRNSRRLGKTRDMDFAQTV
jgi:inositol phosphorylceramide mannosyltransferase catalytic subunit